MKHYEFTLSMKCGGIRATVSVMAYTAGAAFEWVEDWMDARMNGRLNWNIEKCEVIHI